MVGRKETRGDLMKDRPEDTGGLSMASEPERARVSQKGGKGDSGGAGGGGDADARRVQLERDRAIKAQQDKDYQESLDKDKAKDDKK